MKITRADVWNFIYKTCSGCLVLFVGCLIIGGVIYLVATFEVVRIIFVAGVILAIAYIIGDSL